MSGVNTAQHDQVRYTLQNQISGNQIISEPKGWNEDEKEFARHPKYHGVFPKFSNSLRFKGTGRDYINVVRDTQGIQGKIRLIKDYLDENKIWQRAYTGFLDMKTWSDKKGMINIKFHSGGIEEIMKSRINEKVEIERTESIPGSTIPDFEPAQLKFHGRRIFLKSQFNILTASNQADCSVETNAGNTRSDTVGLPLNLFSQSHDQAHTVTPQSDGGEDNGSTGMMFYDLNDRDRILDIDLDIDMDVFFQQYENVQWCFYKASIVRYTNGSNYDVAERFPLLHLDSGNPIPGFSQEVLPDDVDFAFPQFTINTSFSWAGQIELLQDESLGLELYLKSDMFVDAQAGVRAFARNIDGYLNIEEDSNFNETVSNGVMVHELFSRLSHIYLGKSSYFRSNYYGRQDLGYSADGPGAYKMFNHGHWMRGFTKEIPLYKPFATSFKEILESCEVADNIGMGIESIGFGERLIVEDKKDFYNPTVLIRLGSKDEDGIFQYDQVNNLERKEIPMKYYSKINIGSEKGGEYEEVMGLEETNTSSNFSTPIDATDEDYIQLMKTRVDTYGGEIIRRRSILTHPTTDQSGDSDIWMHSVKPGLNGIYDLKRVNDVLETDPIGMFSPESAYNFEFSPISMLQNHGWWIRGGYTKNELDKIKFGSSRGNSRVKLQLINKNAYFEGGPESIIPIQDLEKPRFVPEEISFSYKVSLNLQKQIEGYTVLFGKKIPNIYGAIEFKNEKGELEKGFLMSLKPNKEGKWKLLKTA
jgi:hypothetical protein